MTDRFTDAFLDELRAAVPISRVVGEFVQWDEGKSRRGDMWACCPFHAESTPSFNVTDEKGVYGCFGCDAGGDHFRFLTESQGMSFPDAVAFVAQMGGVAMPEGVSSGKPPRPPEQPREAKTPPTASAEAGKRTTVKTYDYTDRDGGMLYQVRRQQIKMPDGTWARNKDGKGTWKTFMQCRPSGLPDGGWLWGLAGGDYIRPPGHKDWLIWKRDRAERWPDAEVRFFEPGPDHTIYRHPAVEIAIADGGLALITEGEKDADTATALGFCGTTNSSGSKHWTDVHSACFRDADVVICLDNDAAGDRADKLAKSLKGIARRVRVLDFSEHVPGFMSKGDITDWVEKHGGTPEQLSAIIGQLPDYRPRPPASKFGAMTSSDVAGSQIVYDWLIKGLIERHGVFLIVGEPLAGKSFVAQDLGMKVARGVDYGGRKVTQGLVVYVAVEDGKGTKLRQKGYRQFHGIRPDADVPFIIMDPSEGGGFSLMSDDSVDALIAELAAWEDYVGQKLELVIIDTYSMATEGLDEIDGAGTGKVIARLNRIRDKAQTSVGVVHHMNGSGTRVRGHSSLTANVPNVIEVRPMMTIPRYKNEKPEPLLDGEGREKRRAILTKNKNGLSNVKWTFVLPIVEVGIDADGVPITTCVCARPSDNRSDEAPERQRLSDDQKLVYDALMAAQDNAGQDMPHGAGVGPQVKRCAPQGAFVAHVRKKMSFKAGEDEIEARNGEITAFLKRTTTALINAGYMGRDNDLKIVWWTGKSDRPRPRRQEAEPPPPTDVPAEVLDEIKNSPVPF